jgi:hypothetical protein
MTFLDYLISAGGNSERFDFDTPDEAYNFGTMMRSRIAAEGDSKFLVVDISNTVVRVKQREFDPEPVEA